MFYDSKGALHSIHGDDVLRCLEHPGVISYVRMGGTLQSVVYDGHGTLYVLSICKFHLEDGSKKMLVKPIPFVLKGLRAFPEMPARFLVNTDDGPRPEDPSYMFLIFLTDDENLAEGQWAGHVCQGYNDRLDKLGLLLDESV